MSFGQARNFGRPGDCPIKSSFSSYMRTYRDECQPLTGKYLSGWGYLQFPSKWLGSSQALLSPTSSASAFPSAPTRTCRLSLSELAAMPCLITRGRRVAAEPQLRFKGSNLLMFPEISSSYSNLVVVTLDLTQDKTINGTTFTFPQDLSVRLFTQDPCPHQPLVSSCLLPAKANTITHDAFPIAPGFCLPMASGRWNAVLRPMPYLCRHNIQSLLAWSRGNLDRHWSHREGRIRNLTLIRCRF